MALRQSVLGHQLVVHNEPTGYVNPQTTNQHAQQLAVLNSLSRDDLLVVVAQLLNNAAGQTAHSQLLTNAEEQEDLLVANDWNWSEINKQQRPTANGGCTCGAKQPQPPKPERDYLAVNEFGIDDDSDMLVTVNDWDWAAINAKQRG